jgi:hypothetical protein
MIEIQLNEKQKQVISGQINLINSLKAETEKENAILTSMLNLLSDELPEQIQGLRIEVDKLIIE